MNGSNGSKGWMRLLGAMLVAGTLAVGGVDLYHGVTYWSELGPLARGEPLPRFQILTLEGQRIGEQDLEGEVTVLTFWATWCGACRQELRDLDSWVASGGLGDDVHLWAVNIEGQAPTAAVHRKVTGFREMMKLSLPMALGSAETAKAFGVGPIPHTVVVDRTGVIRHVYEGVVSVETLSEQIDALR